MRHVILRKRSLQRNTISGGYILLYRVGGNWFFLFRQHTFDAVGAEQFQCAASDLVPRELLNQQELFVLRFSLAREPGRRLQIMIADAQFPSPGERHLVLDIDVILEAELGTPWGILRVEFEALHERAWSTFSVSCAPRLLEFLKEGSS